MEISSTALYYIRKKTCFKFKRDELLLYCYYAAVFELYYS